jgi:hypothetical protein
MVPLPGSARRFSIMTQCSTNASNLVCSDGRNCARPAEHNPFVCIAVGDGLGCLATCQWLIGIFIMILWPGDGTEQSKRVTALFEVFDDGRGELVRSSLPTAIFIDEPL